MILRALSQPLLAMSVIRMIMVGHYYRIWFRVRRQRATLGHNFRVHGGVYLKGPGTVIFGDNCTVLSTRLSPVTPYTHSSEAILRFGNGVVLNGTRFGCMQRIEVGDNCLLADARIFDSDFHALMPNGRHRWQTTGTAKPVVIGANVWVCAGAMILKGVTIGNNSVVGAGAVVTHDVPPNVVVAGNPARVVAELSHVLQD